jgi:putative PEP-CTERM system TPR-repeat lipoprotein
VQVRNKIILFLLLSNVVFLSNAQLQESNDDYEKALQSFHQNKFNEAYIHTKNVLKESPNHLPSKILLGKIHIHRNEANAAIDILNEAIDMNAHPNFITVPLANAYKLKKNYDKIIKLSFDKLNKNNEFELIILQANAYKILEKFDLSLNKYNQALTIKTKSIVANTELAYLYIQLGRVKEAESVASLLESIATEQPFTLHIKGLIAQQTNKPDQALNLFEQAYQKDKKSPFIARSLASFYISQQKYDLARKVVDGILIETPDEPFIMLLNARLFTINDKNDLANQAYIILVQKLQLIPSDSLSQLPELVYISGLANYMIANYENAQNQLRIYLKNDEELEDKEKLKAIRLLTDINIKQNRKDQAIQLLKKHEIIVLSDIRLSLALCNLYISDDKARKCQLILDDLSNSHGPSMELDLMQVKTLQAQNQFSEALAYFEASFEKNDNELVLQTAVSLYIQNNNEEKALLAINTLLTKKPDSTYYQFLQSDILLTFERYEKAEPLVRNMLKATPDSFSARFNLARLHYIKEEYFEAQKLAEKLIVNKSMSFRLYILLGNALFKQGKLTESLEAFQRAKRSAGKDPLPSEQIVKIHRLLKQPEAAISELRELGKTYFLAPKYIQQKAEIYLEQKQIAQAKKEYQLLFSLWGDDNQKLLYLAQVQRSAKFYDDAEETLQVALTLKPNFLYTKIELMRLYLSQNRVKETEALAKELIKKHKNNADIQFIMGNVAYYKKQYSLTSKYYSKAIDLDNNYQIAIIKLYKLAINENFGHNIFTKKMSSIIKKHPDSSFHRHIFADYLFSQNKLAEAKSHYEILEQIENLPNKTFIYNNLANVLISENLDKALFYVNKALAIDRSTASFYDTKGWILSLQNKYQQGLNPLRQANAIDDNNASNKYHIAYTLDKLGRKKEALIEVNAALAIDGVFKEKQLALKLKATL